MTENILYLISFSRNFSSSRSLSLALTRPPEQPISSELLLRGSAAVLTSNRRTHIRYARRAKNLLSRKRHHTTPYDGSCWFAYHFTFAWHSLVPTLHFSIAHTCVPSAGRAYRRPS